jgi:uncharacterized membrane protein YgcG
MRGIDLSSWQSLLSTLLTLALVTLVGLGLRLVVMSSIQQRRERANRQINERLRVLIAAYKTLGGSFTGDLTVDPIHRRELRKRTEQASPGEVGEGGIAAADLNSGSDRSRRMRDAVEAALSDIILLGTEEQVRMAAHAARELVAGRHLHTHELVISLRDFIRKALDLDPIPTGLEIPMQGPTRPGAAGSGERGRSKENAGGGGERGGGGGSGGGGAMGIGMGMGGMAGLGLGHGAEDHTDEIDPAKGGE